MVQVLQPPAPRQSWGDVLGPLGEALGARMQQNQAQERQVAQNTILQRVLEEISSNPNASFNDIASAFARGGQQGLDPSYSQQYMQNAPRFQQVQNQALAKQQAAAKPDPKAQAWAYTQLNAEPLIKKSNEAIAKILELSEKDVTGPVKGRVPDWASSEAARKIRSAIDAEALNVIGTHGTLFRNGTFTDREFNFIKDKTLSSKMSKEQIKEVAKIYQEMNDLAMRRFAAIRKAASEGGFTADLPLRVADMEKEAGDLKEKLLNEVGYKEESPSNTVQVTEISTGRTASMTPEEAQEYEGNPDFTISGDQQSPSPQSDEEWLQSEEGQTALMRSRSRKRK